MPLRADTFKWPHHSWLPSDETQQEDVAKFLKVVNPTRVFISVGPDDLRGQSVDTVKEFLKRVLPNADVFVTRDDGHIQLITRLIAKGLVPAA